MNRSLSSIFFGVSPLSANFTKWSNTLKQFVGKYMFDHFMGLALKGFEELRFYNVFSQDFPNLKGKLTCYNK